MANDIKRLNYFTGQFLEAVDFSDEQSYHIDMRRRLNASFRGPGILDGGFKVTVVKDRATTTDPAIITVGAGIGVNNKGEELLILPKSELEKKISQDNLNTFKNQTIAIYLCYHEEPSDNKAVNQEVTSGYTRWTEKPDIILQLETDSAPTDSIRLENITVDNEGIISSLDEPVRQLASLWVDGKVGIGTKSPQLQLHVEGGSEMHSGGIGGGVSFSDRGKDFVISPTAGERWVWFAQSGTARLWSGSDKLSITADGHVGIGTATPAFPLSIRAAGTGEQLLGFEDPNGKTKWNFNLLLGGNYSGLYFCETGIANDRLFLQNGGNIGIGTLTPTAKLEVNGTLKVSGNGHIEVLGQANVNDAAIILGRSSGDPGSLFIVPKLGTGGYNSLSQEGDFGLFWRANSKQDAGNLVIGPWNDTTAGIKITASGNVGIGTATPEQMLSVGSGLNVDHTNTNVGTLHPGITFGLSSGEGISSNRNGTVNQYGLDFYTNSAVRLSITNAGDVSIAGKVGIGTATPEQMLSVGSGLNVDHTNTNVGTLHPGITFGLSSGEGISSNRNGTVNQYGLDFYTNSAVRLSITNAGDVSIAGKVGIGTATPEQMLSVQSGLNVDQGDYNAGGIQPGISFGSGSGVGIASWRRLEDPHDRGSIGSLNFYTGGAVRLTIYDSGEITIGGTINGKKMDLAENYYSDAELEPGDVVSFDPSEDRIVLSSQPVEHFVCGVISTAPGFVLNSDSAGQSGKWYPVALAGRVPCKVTDENGPIRRGDLLTSSSSPGYAMKAQPILVNGEYIFSAGTVIGKSLGNFESGQGSVDIFVCLR